MQLSHLFSPVTINSLEIRNRAVMPAMGTGYGNIDGSVSDRLIAYLARRARGGTGLIITEVCAIDPRGKGFPNEIGAWSDTFIPGLSMLATAIHQEGGKVALQLHHAGRETLPAFTGALPEAPSPIPSAILMQPCEEMHVDRIAEIVAAYAQAAARAKTAGCDAVEIHAAHGYLINQFLSPFSNQRQDRYGGSDENRARFALEIIGAVRRQVGPDYPILVRVSADELVPGGYDLAFMQWLAPRLVSAGADAIHVSLGVFSTPGNLSVASMDTEPGFNLHRARAIKQVVHVPVIGVGRINDPRLADEAIARGDADLISFGRQHLTDPDFINKAKHGAFDEIRCCLACNQGCIERLMFEMKPVTCTINPACGKEYKDKPPRVERPHKVWVIGAGPAGLSAALSAMERGRQVEIFERAEKPGGQLLSASQPPHKQAFSAWVDWAVGMLKKNGVAIRTTNEVTAEMIAKDMPKAVILATGSRPISPAVPGIDSPPVCDAREVLLGRTALKSLAIVLGAGYVGMETADFLMAHGVKVTVMEMQAMPPVGKHTAHGYWLNQRLEKGGGTLMLGAEVVRIEPDAVIYRQAGEERRLAPASMIITALGARPEDELVNTLKKFGIPHQVVGDARTPRRLLEAVHEGTAAGEELQ